MLARLDTKRLMASLIVGATIVGAITGFAAASGRRTTALQEGEDTACVSMLQALTMPAGSVVLVDNGLVRDTIVVPSPALTQNQSYVAARRCVDSVDVYRRGRGQRSLMADYSRLAMTHSMIPEYHDEQRLPDGAGGLGPKAHIYASPNLGDFRQRWQVGEHDKRGVLVAHVFVDPLPGEAVPQTYLDLGLRRGLNCVWLARPYGGAWRGFVRPVNGQGECDHTVPMAVSLSVKVSAEGGPDSLYPPVARFGESDAGKPLLGVKCLNAWCELGAGGFNVVDPLPKTFGDLTPRATIKGWHDEQVLSVRSPAANMAFLPTSAPALRAALVPRVGVEWLSPIDFLSGWQEVGYLYLDNDPPAGSKYATWGLKQGKNTLALRRFAGNWSVRMISATGAMFVWRITDRDRHVDAGVPGTARFRWTVGDDGIWLPCGQHCCHMEG